MRYRPTKLAARLRALARHPLSSKRRKAYREQLRLPVFATPLTDAERPVVLPMDVPLAELCVMVRRRLPPERDGASPPVVSIVIPVRNQLDYTLRCLISIAAHPSRASVEIVVCDDASNDDTPGVLAALPGIRYIRNADNLGFLHSCNRAAGEARGAYLLFLNNDTQVQEGWLDHMLALFGSEEQAGLVGAKLLFPDGRLQEAGGIVWQDASGHHYGRYDDPRKPEYNHVREVDYCSGACLMIEAASFRTLGGFDVRYAPAYYEDTDLAFRVRQAGRKVLFQPKAVVVHHEGVSNGTDTRSGIKACLMTNQAKFRQRWRKELEELHMPKPH
jgi:GT2 family glycosyltransferase